VTVKKKSGKAGFLVVWEFRISSGKRREFERIYGPNGDWERLFRDGKGYICTELIRDLGTSRRYLTLDFWTSREAYARFKEENRAEYRAIDERCASLTESEVLIGEFQRGASQKRWRP
jgi:heme-degrading monooxygenase HmoA